MVWDFTPGTVVFSQTDPAGDDNGPGNYAYPTSSNFVPGAYDITNFQVIVSPDGATTTFKLQTRDLTPTFGSPLGAQLADVYVHDPAASTTSTAASFPQRNYQIAAGSAWSRLLEVQGFGQRYVDASGNTVGTIAISANAHLAVHHVQRADGQPRRHARFGLGLHRGADRPGRLRARPGPQLHGDAAAVQLRRVRYGEHRPALHLRPRTRSRRRWTSWCPAASSSRRNSTTPSARSCFRT